MDRRQFITGATIALGLAASHQVNAQADSTIRVIFPFAAGGGGDALCRIMAEELRASLRRNVIVENRTGANGLIAIKGVMAAPPDGLNILITTGPTMYLLPMVENTPSFEAKVNFTPISVLGRFEFAIVAGKGTGAKTYAQLIDWLKANPEKASYGVPSNGTIPHFAGTVLEKLTGLKMSHVAYRGGAPVMNDLSGGHIAFGIVALADALPLHQSGNISIVAMSSEKRSPFLLDVPTLKENGINLVADAWYGMWLPANTPKAIVDPISSAVMVALTQPDVQEKLLKIGIIPQGSSPGGLLKQMDSDIMQWKPVVEATGYKISQ